MCRAGASVARCLWSALEQPLGVKLSVVSLMEDRVFTLVPCPPEPRTGLAFIGEGVGVLFPFRHHSDIPRGTVLPSSYSHLQGHKISRIFTAGTGAFQVGWQCFHKCQVFHRHTSVQFPEGRQHVATILFGTKSPGAR